MNGQALLPFQKMTFVFDRPMKDQVDITWDKGEWNCVWFTFAGVPRKTLECSLTNVVDPGSFRWTLCCGFISVGGEALSPISGTMIIGDGGGGDGAGGGSIVTQAPDCGADHSALPFPKRVNLCGPDIHA